MIAQSQSGTGKTAAFVLTMLSRVNPDENFPQVMFCKLGNICSEILS
jgi:ATP-dependent RNA helicase DDX19/DBP5